METKKILKRKTLEGTVVSDKMQNTVVVTVVSRKPHPKYKKIITFSKRYKAHVYDDANKPAIGSKVVIKEHKPISKDKSWIVVQ